MHIFFSKAFDSGVYPHPYQNNTHPGRRFVGEKGLLNILELETGAFARLLPEKERVLIYKTALEKVMEDEVDAFYAESFRQDPISVSEELLSWRDQLVLNGWKNIKRDQQAGRLSILYSVEKTFNSDNYQYYGEADQWRDILEKAGNLKNVKEITILDVKEYMHPFFLSLFEELTHYTKVNFETIQNDFSGNSNLTTIKKSLSTSGKKQKVKLNPLNKDNSFVIIRSSDEFLAADFITDQVKRGYKPVFINPESSVLDYALAADNLAVSGSELNNSNPQLIQIFKLAAVSLFWPANVKNLLSFLQMPFLPFSPTMARKLSDCLIGKPGVDNVEWKNIIEKQLEFLEKIDEEKGKEKAEKNRKAVKLYLDFEEREDSARVDEIRNVYADLASWAKSTPHIDNFQLKEEEKDQFFWLYRLCQSLLKELENIGGEPDKRIPKGEFDRLIETLYEPGNFINYRRQKNSLSRLKDPGCLTGKADHVCWMNWQGGVLRPDDLFFLTGDERSYLLRQGLKLFEPNKQVKRNFEMMKRGVLNTKKQLILIQNETAKGEKTEPHPLTAFINSNIENPDAVTLDAYGLKDWAQMAFEKESGIDPVKPLKLPEIKTYWENIDGLKNHHSRQYESPTSIEKLIQNPFDWVLEYLGGIKPARAMILPALFTTKGNVAHAATEEIMMAIKEEPQKEFSTETLNEILEKHTRAQGLEFLLPENRFEFFDMKQKFLNAIKNLMDIIQKNNLEVLGAELIKKQEIGGIGWVEGKIDLVLKEPGGRPVVFDLKWTVDDKKYIGKIEESKDIQLIIYYALLAKETNQEAKTGFFLFNTGKLYTRNNFEGENVQKIEIEGLHTENEVLDKIVKGFQFRKTELNQGIIEMGEECHPDELNYHAAEGAEERIALDTTGEKDNEMKKKNWYSELTLFKGFVK